MRRINYERKKVRSLRRLRVLGKMAKSARAHSAAMAAAGNLFHQDVKALRVKWGASGAAENVAFTSWRGEDRDVALRMVQSWIQSQGHNENMFNPIWRRTGCAVYDNGVGFWATCLYAVFP